MEPGEYNELPSKPAAKEETEWCVRVHELPYYENFA
jgi:hypothetical protein